MSHLAGQKLPGGKGFPEPATATHGSGHQDRGRPPATATRHPPRDASPGRHSV
ncbi:hypothetical protein SGL43_03611 [Streptomyces globisporus]|uniref:Uncharacterized protein n=1 Tax=Streptomyces globisporus TaxID=1908 RepID=A0ABM9GZ57_STRGL|nr:hypothetical protein SGL43_03611 [Streptomyces globisporus]